MPKEPMNSRHKDTLSHMIEKASFEPFWIEASTKQQIERSNKIRKTQYIKMQGLLNQSKFMLALPLLEELSDLTPSNQNYRESLYQTQIRLGLFHEALHTLNQLPPSQRERLQATLDKAKKTQKPASKDLVNSVDSRIQLRRARQCYSISLGWGSLSKFDPTACSGMSFTIVTGLPRSGTSLMMQLLRSAGLEICADILGGDKCNPGGYLESKRMERFFYDPVLLEALGSSAIKLFLDQIAYLPISHNYKIVFMQRPMDEVLTSQKSFFGLILNSKTILTPRICSPTSKKKDEKTFRRNYHNGLKSICIASIFPS